MEFKRLAVASAITASLAMTTVVEAGVSYHMTDAGIDTAWSNNTVSQGVWTDGSPVDQGYGAALPVTWLANVDANDTNYEVSSANAVAAGANSSYTLSSIANNWRKSDAVSGGDASWGHTLDFGLIDMSVAGDLTVEVKADSSLSSDFVPGFTVWQGWGDPGTGDKHSAWNFLSSADKPFFGTAVVAPLFLGGVSYLGEDSTTVSAGTATLTLNNLAAGKYIVFIGGNSDTPTTNDTYMANISVSAVPVPAAVWLMGSAMLGLVGIGRKRKG